MKKRGLKIILSILIVSMVLASCPLWNCEAEAANADPALGQICLMAFGYAPKGWADCNGALVSISKNQALFSILGTAFGGDGRTTFALPNLQSPVTGARYCISTQGYFPIGDFYIDTFCGQIELLPYTWKLSDWVRCEGQTLSVNDYQKLYSVIGNKFGGTPDKDFKLPDLRGTAPDENLHYYIALTGIDPKEGCYSDAGSCSDGVFYSDAGFYLMGSINLYIKDARFESNDQTSSGICDGSAFDINTHDVLYELIGKTYGGNGTTFNKPDLRGAEPDPRLSYYLQVGGIFPPIPN